MQCWRGHGPAGQAQERRVQVYDVIMLAVLAGCAAFGALKGMAWQLASIGSLVASYFVALRFSDQLAPYLGKEAPLNQIAAMLALYLATSLCIWIAFRFVKGFIDRVKLKEFDRQVGGLFGAAKGVLLCVVITFFAVFLSADARQAILRSRSGYYIAELIDRVGPLLPEDVHAKLGPYLDKLDEQLDPTHEGQDSALDLFGQPAAQPRPGDDQPAARTPPGGLFGAPPELTEEALRRVQNAILPRGGEGASGVPPTAGQ
jgi:membrane protein required for colicin V production